MSPSWVAGALARAPNGCLEVRFGYTTRAGPICHGEFKFRTDSGTLGPIQHLDAPWRAPICEKLENRGKSRKITKINEIQKHAPSFHKGPPRPRHGCLGPRWVNFARLDQICHRKIKNVHSLVKKGFLHSKIALSSHFGACPSVERLLAAIMHSFLIFSMTSLV